MKNKLKLPRFLIRILAFLRKEVVEVIRQPMLVVTLVLGPFLILLFFGIGYRNEPRALRTVFVTQGDDRLNEKIEQYAAALGRQLVFAGITDDLTEAQASLQAGEIDLITVVPARAYETVRDNQQAVFELVHQEIDPLQVDYITVFGRVYIDEINRRVLQLVTSEGQVNVSQAQAKLEIAQASAIALREILEACVEALAQPVARERCDEETAQGYISELDRSIDEADLALGDNVRLNSAIQETLGDTTVGESDDVSLAKIIRETNELSELGDTVDDYLTSLETMIALEQDLNVLRERLNNFLDIDPSVLISPFASEAKNVAAINPGVTGFFAPSVIILLLQHLAVTFGALSMVREHQLGTMELFFVSPLAAIEALLGKYISYLIFGSALAAVLISLIVFGLGVPLLGHWSDIVIVVMALLFTSMGIGFVISLFSKTDIQAVQYSMIVLLTSVFFSGFFLSLDALWEPVRVISWSLPATYGILLLREVMLRGNPLIFTLLGWLIAIGLGLFGLAWFLLNRSMAYSSD